MTEKFRHGLDQKLVANRKADDVGATEVVSHAPPSEVVGVTVQFNVPVPPFPTWMRWVTPAPPFLSEKLSLPGRLSKNAPEATIVSVTGTLRDRAGLANSITVISPV